MNENDIELVIIQNDREEPPPEENLENRSITTLRDISTRDAAIQNLKNQPEDQFVFHFIIKRVFKPFDNQNFGRLKEVLRDKQIVAFQIESNGKFSIVWRKSEDEVYAINIFPNNIEKEDLTKLCVYVLEFLHDCLDQNHSGLASYEVYYIIKHNIDITSLAFTNNMNLLLDAALNGNSFIIPVLLDVAFNVNMSHNGFIVVAYAYSNWHFGAVLELLKRDSIFPPGTTLENCLSEEIKEFAQKSRELNERIKAGNLEEITRIMSENPNFRAFHNIENQSAMAVALINKKFDVYEFLLQKNMCLSQWEDINEITEHLNEKEKNDVHDIHFRNKKDLDNHHLNVLMSKCSVGHNAQNVQNYLEHVMRAFRVLNGFNVIQILLKIAALLPNLEIVFDFNHYSINYLDPNQNRNNTGMFYLNGRIYIGAKQLLDSLAEHEVFATIAHELCHFVLYMLFKNYAKPYNEKDSETEEEFEAISKECKRRKRIDKIICAVYDFYKQEMHHTELIVRIPHFFGHYFNQPEKIEKLRVHFKSLFDFYELKLLPELEEKLKKLQAEAEKKRKAKDRKISMLIMSSIIGFIVMVFVAISMTYWVYEPTYSWSDLDNEQKMKVFNGSVKFEGIDLKFNELYGQNESSSEVFEKLNSNQIKTFLKDEILKLNEHENKFLQDDLYLVYRNLTKTLQEKVEKAAIEFQGELVIICSLFANETKNFLLTLNTTEIIELTKNQSSIKFGQKLMFDTDLYIERHYIDKSYDFNPNKKYYNPFKPEDLLYTVSLSDLFNEYLRKKVILLSDDAGKGKTTELKNLALKVKKEFPLKWVEYVDVKSKVKIFEIYQRIEDENIDVLDILTDRFNRKDYEMFQMLFNNSEVIILWDGFDEVSPTYTDLMLRITDSIKTNTQNIQFISTRPHCERIIRDTLDCTALKLAPYSKEDNEKYFEKYFTLKNLSDYQKQIAMINVKELIEKVQKHDPVENEINVIKNPLLLQMITEVAINNDGSFDGTNLYTIYDSFINIKLEISNYKGKIALNEKNDFLLKGVHLTEVFQYFAIRQYNYNYEDLKILKKYRKNELPINALSRYGILVFDNANNAEFTHRAFLEYFLAKYIIDNIYNANNETNCDTIDKNFLWFNKYLEDFVYGNNENFLEGYLDTKAKHEINEDLMYCFQTHSDLNNWFYNIAKRFKIDSFQYIYKTLQLFPFTKKSLEVLWHLNENQTFFNWFAIDSSVQYMNHADEIEKIVAKYFPDELEKQKLLLFGKHQRGNLLYSVHQENKAKSDIEKSKLQFLEYFNLTNFNLEEFENISTPLQFYRVTKSFLSDEEIREFSKSHFISILKEGKVDMWNEFAAKFTRKEMQEMIYKGTANGKLFGLRDFALKMLFIETLKDSSKSKFMNAIQDG